MSNKKIALIRGINVGRAKRLAMADFREILEKLGCSEINTILNSGNAVFVSEETDNIKLASLIEEAIFKKAQFSAKVMVFTEEELKDIVEDNTLHGDDKDPSRLLVMFLQNPGELNKLKPLEGQQWSPDAMAIGRRAAYLWCADGVLASSLNIAAARVLGDKVTARNWATVLKIHVLTTKISA